MAKRVHGPTPQQQLESIKHRIVVERSLRDQAIDAGHDIEAELHETQVDTLLDDYIALVRQEELAAKLYTA